MKHTTQSGRSMVEMLGALAVMGVLSVGGLHAFSSIMDRFRANDLLEGASARAMRVSEQIKKGRKTLSLGKFFDNEVSGGTFSKQVFTEGLTKQFGIQVSNVKKAVCERLLDSITDTSPLRRLALSETPRNPLTQCQDENTFLMIYNGGFKGESQDTEYQCETNSQCPSGQNCQDGFCTCPNNEKYVYTATGRSSGKKTCCDPELVVGDVCCNSVEYDEFTGEKLCCGYNSASAGCCPEGYFAYNNNCYSCDDPKAIRVIQEGYCSVCPQRSRAGHMCVLECPEADQINQNNRCYCPDDKPVMTSEGKCYSCDSGIKGVWYSDSTLLLKDSGWTSNVMDVCGAAGYCGNYTCYGGYMSFCPEGKIGNEWSGRYSFLLSDGTKAANATCYDCSEVDISSIKVESQCNICSGTWNGETWYDKSGNSCTPPEAASCSGIDCGENECVVCNPENGACENMCQSVEYLESTGAQWIDTGVIPQYNFKFETKILLTTVSDDYFSSCRIDGGNTRFYALNMNSGAGFATSASSWGGTGYVNYMPSNFLNTPHEITSNIQQDKVSINVDGVLKEKTNTVGTISSQTLPLFGGKLNNSSNATAYSKSGTRCYYAKYYLDGSLVRDFVPVIAPNGKAAMFDQVSKKLFYNKGSGTFKTNLDE